MWKSYSVASYLKRDRHHSYSDLYLVQRLLPKIHKLSKSLHRSFKEFLTITQQLSVCLMNTMLNYIQLLEVWLSVERTGFANNSWIKQLLWNYWMSFTCLQCWENGIILCRKIAEQYESYYDYRNLSKMRVTYPRTFQQSQIKKLF